MHWSKPIIIIWVIELAGFIILSRGILLLFKSLKRLEENFKKPLRSILISFLIYLILGLYVTIAISKQFSYDSYLWVITFALGVFVSIFLVIGAKKLLQELENA